MMEIRYHGVRLTGVRFVMDEIVLKVLSIELTKLFLFCPKFTRQSHVKSDSEQRTSDTLRGIFFRYKY